MTDTGLSVPVQWANTVFGDGYWSSSVLRTQWQPRRNDTDPRENQSNPKAWDVGSHDPRGYVACCLIAISVIPPADAYQSKKAHVSNP